MLSHSLLNRVWQHVGLCRAQEVERRIVAMPFANDLELIGDAVERLAFVAIPVVAIAVHARPTPYAFLNKVSAYCRCPLTCISFSPVSAAISARVIPWT